ncbi:DUF928 domain-containing protein [Planktothrix sp. FACHB-1355]|uniref:DUF928 domain-containing protein n=1 Tax=Aerosakkonema funiforme FACHB-1375 TaxID=2949571 RepID=A0A926VBZ7_9CYAN|nr:MULTISPECIES: DUF928 domain-containing protein [Oscillatoriales]MBD2181069.1 DUF928 domain-containing protein [Aerosakkonema funiforme FACHB-1375]MBD3558825.1 DUF928 domain-containing protein [Planktothrix sp. FACHB-1355]
MKLLVQKLSLPFSIAWITLNFTSNATTVQAQRTTSDTNRDFIQAQSSNQQPLDFSGTGRPDRRTTGGSRRGCPSVDIPLTPLRPEYMGSTVSEYPTFWVYVPYNSNQIQSGEFVLQDEEADREIYRTPFTLRETPGIVRLRLPSNPQYALKIGKTYRWYFKLFCNTQDKSVYVFVQGLIQRVPLNSLAPDYNAYAISGIWYDALTDLADKRRRALDDAVLKENWIALLKAVKLQNLAEERLVECCTPEKN